MQVMKLTQEQINAAPKKHRYTEKEMQQEYAYLLAQQMTKRLLEKDMISEEEFHKITTKIGKHSLKIRLLYAANPLIILEFRGNM
ncbi:SHOCT domain-containing protein [Blautia sp.]|uniref:SHOCT domain-containing protein n=1 Tax=Blautia sp. TaxID=1955243 RepID=UPI003993A57A